MEEEYNFQVCSNLSHEKLNWSQVPCTYYLPSLPAVLLSPDGIHGIADSQRVSALFTIIRRAPTLVARLRSLLAEFAQIVHLHTARAS